MHKKGTEIMSMLLFFYIHCVVCIEYSKMKKENNGLITSVVSHGADALSFSCFLLFISTVDLNAFSLLVCL